MPSDLGYLNLLVKIFFIIKKRSSLLLLLASKSICLIVLLLIFFRLYIVVQLLSCVWLFETPWTAIHKASLFFTISRSLLKLMSVVSMMPSNHLILCCPLLLLHSIFPRIRIFSNELAPCIRWPKYWSFSFSISLTNEYSGLISFRIDWLDLLVVQRTLKSLLKHHSSKASVLWHSAFFMVQLSDLYMTTGKTIALTRHIFVGKVISLLFNMLSGFVVALLPRSKHLLISWLQSLSAVILESKKIKSVTVSTFFLSMKTTITERLFIYIWIYIFIFLLLSLFNVFKALDFKYVYVAYVCFLFISTENLSI